MPRDFKVCVNRLDGIEVVAVLNLPKCPLVYVYDSYFVVYLDFMRGTSRWWSDIASSVSLAWPGNREPPHGH